jgi:hypothetical protein
VPDNETQPIGNNFDLMNFNHLCQNLGMLRTVIIEARARAEVALAETGPAAGIFHSQNPVETASH